MRSAALLLGLLTYAVEVHPEAAEQFASRISPSSPPSVAKLAAPSVSSDEVSEWLRQWQKRLGLEDWKLESKIVRMSELPKGTLANIHWSLVKKQAIIRVLHSADSTLPPQAIARDTELSVVHELVHLTMAKLPLENANPKLEEETVKKLSGALLDLKNAETAAFTVQTASLSH